MCVYGRGDCEWEHFQETLVALYPPIQRCMSHQVLSLSSITEDVLRIHVSRLGPSHARCSPDGVAQLLSTSLGKQSQNRRSITNGDIANFYLTIPGGFQAFQHAKKRGFNVGTKVPVLSVAVFPV